MSVPNHLPLGRNTRTAMGSVLEAFCTGLSALVVGPSTTRAGVDDERSVVNGDGRTLTIHQWDTVIDPVLPRERQRSPREWFHSGCATYTVAGPTAESFAGTVELGYRFGFPQPLGVGTTFAYATANIFVADASVVTSDADPRGPGRTSTQLPGVSVTADLGNRPTVHDITTVSVKVSGPVGTVAVFHAHGAMTDVATGLLLCPFARLVRKDGDSVTAYGEPSRIKPR